MRRCHTTFARPRCWAPARWARKSPPTWPIKAFPVLLLDIVPKDAADDPKDRNRVVVNALENLHRLKPAPLAGGRRAEAHHAGQLRGRLAPAEGRRLGRRSRRRKLGHQTSALVEGRRSTSARTPSSAPTRRASRFTASPRRCRSLFGRAFSAPTFSTRRGICTCWK